MIVLTLFLAIGVGVLFLHTPESEVYTLDDTLYQQVSSQDGYVYLNDISPDFLEILVANEDRRFYQHVGLDLKRTLGAAVGNIKAHQTITGGSTISQQLAKNLFYSQEQTYTRKLLEFGTALRLEYYFSKAQILEMYINVIYYGSDAYGIADASSVYFNKLPIDLTEDESATLVGLLPAPSVYNPMASKELSEKRKLEALTNYRVYLTEKTQ